MISRPLSWPQWLRNATACCPDAADMAGLIAGNTGHVDIIDEAHRLGLAVANLQQQLDVLLEVSLAIREPDGYLRRLHAPRRQTAA